MTQSARLACLGPIGTYSSKAATQYLQRNTQIQDVLYFDNVEDFLHQPLQTYDHIIVAIENTCEGFISPNIQGVIASGFQVIDQLSLNIQFSFIYNCPELNDIESLFVHPVARSQTSYFLSSMRDAKVCLSYSNAHSYQLFLEKQHHGAVGAVIPHYLAQAADGHGLMPDVNNVRKNQTRFLILTRPNATTRPNITHNVHLALFRPAVKNHSPLNYFSAKQRSGINFRSIVPIPSGDALGQYLYYTEIDALSAGQQHDLARLFEDSQWTPLGGYQQKPAPNLRIGRNGLVCRCHQVTTTTIAQALRNTPRATTLDIAAQTKAASGCGACAELVSQLVQEHNAQGGPFDGPVEVKYVSLSI